MSAQPVLRIAALAFVLLGFASARPCQAAIAIDLGYVDTQSAAYGRFISWVDQALGGEPGYAFSATDAAYAYRLSGNPAYATLAAQHVEAQVAAAEAAIAIGERPEVAADSYLYAGPMIRDLALTLDWCADAITPAQRARWSAYAGQAVWNIWHHEQAQWGGHAQPWSGWATDDPANNYYYSFVEATMYWALASNSADWLQLLAEDKLPALEHSVAGIDGGGSQEGTGYGLSHRTLFSLYRVWRDSTPGHIDLANANGHLVSSIAWWIHATVPTLDRIAPIGDQARVSEPVVYDYHRALMLEARALSVDPGARDDASWWLHAIANQTMESGFNYRDNLLPAGDGGTPPDELVYHALGTGQLFARTGWDRHAVWLQFSAGPYLQSHAHQDQGAFTLYQDNWLAVSANIWSRSGIQQGTEVHNVLRFEQQGAVLPQREGTTSTMVVTPGPGGDVHAVADLTPAYAGAPGVQQWQRTIDFADRVLTVHDRFSLGNDTRAVFQVNLPTRPLIEGRTATAGNLRIRVLAPTDASLQALDWTAQADTDGDSYSAGWRLDIGGSGSEYVVELAPLETAPGACEGAMTGHACTRPLDPGLIRPRTRTATPPRALPQP